MWEERWLTALGSVAIGFVLGLAGALAWRDC
jgi:hypothetical protein